ncbi:hypothetical protein D3C72_2172400 [compost metagenome]
MADHRITLMPQLRHDLMEFFGNAAGVITAEGFVRIPYTRRIYSNSLKSRIS